MQSPDHPELLYVEARKTDGSPMYTIGRPDGPPLWHVIHDMEAVETISCAENTANYFASGAGGRNVSSHYTADNNSIVQCVLLRHSAWTVGNRPGNNRGINWELCGFAAQTREQWLDAFGTAMFDRVVMIMRQDGLKYGIPPVRRTVAELQAGVKGVTSHNDLRLAFGGTSHTDPGSNFPWDYFIDLLNGGWMTPDQEKKVLRTIDNLDRMMSAWLTNTSEVFGIQNSDGTVTNYPNTARIPIPATVSGGTGSGLTEAQVRSIVRQELDKTKLGFDAG